jgi:hypothetical protein
VKRLAALDAHFVERNVPLQVLAGVAGVLATVRAVLPAHAPPSATHDADERDADEQTAREPIDPFVALLLGVLVAHDGLTALLRDDQANPRDPHLPDVAVADDVLAAFPGLLR